MPEQRIADAQHIVASHQIPKAFAYTCPAITFSDDTHMQDSRKIADRLEELQPSPSMRLDSPVLKEIEGIMPKIMMAIAPVMMPLVPRNLLNER